jgi:AcrR family transcriptional regulator
VEAILDAAESVVSEIGVDATTTNAIAERAGASVGSLYHFFANKDAILLALAERYANSAKDILQQSSRLDEPWVPLSELFTQMIAAFAEMDKRNPAYMAVCRATDSASGGKSSIALQLEAQMQVMVQALIQRRSPDMPAGEVYVHAMLSRTLVHSVLDQVPNVSEEHRQALLAALVQMLVCYFTPVEAQYARPERA